MYICLNLLILFMIHGVVGYFGHNRNRTELTESKICSDFVVTKLIAKTEEPVSSVRLDRTPGLKHITTQLIDLGLRMDPCAAIYARTASIYHRSKTQEKSIQTARTWVHTQQQDLVTRDRASFLFFFKYSNCILYITHTQLSTYSLRFCSF